MFISQWHLNERKVPASQCFLQLNIMLVFLLSPLLIARREANEINFSSINFYSFTPSTQKSKHNYFFHVECEITLCWYG